MTNTVGEYPVCLTDPDLRFANGSIGTAWGGSFTSDALADSAGTFARREKADPSKIPVDAQFGVRCVGVAGVEGSGAPSATTCASNGSTEPRHDSSRAANAEPAARRFSSLTKWRSNRRAWMRGAEVQSNP